MKELKKVDGIVMFVDVPEEVIAERRMLMQAVRNLPEIEPEKIAIADNGGYIGKHAELSVYDAMLAEIMGEHDGEKARVRNRRRNDRKHNVLPKVRKQMRYDRGWNRYLSMPCYGCKNIGIAEYRMDNAETVARADWKLESAEIAEEEEWERFNRELEEFDRKWREDAEAEQRRMREYRKMRELNEWLKYA